MSNTEKTYALSDCVNWKKNPKGDCGGRMEVINGTVICETCANRPVHTYEVQVGRGQGRYETRYSFTNESFHCSRAWLYYSSINIGRGFKKRLLRDGKVVARQFS